MGCCEPVKCGSCEPRELAEGPSDSCLCGFLFLNGFFAGLLSQTLLLVGMLFSLAALGDCSFVTTDSKILLPEEGFEGLGASFSDFNRLGMLFFARPNGECYWYEDGQYPEDQIQWYITDLTPSWHVARGFAAVGALGGFLVFCYSLSLICSAQKKGARLFMAFFLSVILACFQFLSTLAFSSSFCQDNDCNISRACSWSIVAGCLYCCSGVCFLFMSDYPGSAILAQEEERAAYLKSQAAPSLTGTADEAEAGVAAVESAAFSSPDDEHEHDSEIVEVDAKVIGEETAPTTTAMVEEDTPLVADEGGQDEVSSKAFLIAGEEHTSKVEDEDVEQGEATSKKAAAVKGNTPAASTVEENCVAADVVKSKSTSSPA